MKSFIGFVVALGLLVGMASPAFATECTGMIADIEAKLASAQIDQSKEDKILDLVEQGRELHESGNHDGAIEILNQALSMLEE